MNEFKNPVATYAFEGINASGKSTMLEKISLWYSDRGYFPLISKIGGIGDDVKKIKQILEHREIIKREKKLTLKQEKDILKDRVFRLAIRQQVRNYKKGTFDMNRTISLLDRTPLMSYAYVSAANPDNPYLDEILGEGLSLTNQLSLDKIFFFDVDPVIVYSRIICRCLESRGSTKNQVLKLVELIKATKDIKADVAKQSFALLDSGIAFKKKKFRTWDFMSYEEVKRQTQTYFNVLKIAEEKLGIQVVRIDATLSLDQVANSIEGHMI